MSDAPGLRTPVTPVHTRLLLNLQRPSVRLGPPQTDAGRARLALGWAAPPGGRPVDLHLGCLWQTDDGESGAMQSYGGSIRLPRSGEPVATLDGGDGVRGESISLDLTALRRLRRLVAYVYAVCGLPDWSLMPAVTMRLDGGGTVEMPVGAPPAGTTICAVASLHQVDGTLVVRREAEYLRGQQSNVAMAYDFEVSFASGHPRGSR